MIASVAKLAVFIESIRVIFHAETFQIPRCRYRHIELLPLTDFIQPCLKFLVFIITEQFRHIIQAVIFLREALCVRIYRNHQRKAY